jgi:hypothetical protein
MPELKQRWLGHKLNRKEMTRLRLIFLDFLRSRPTCSDSGRFLSFGLIPKAQGKADVEQGEKNPGQYMFVMFLLAGLLQLCADVMVILGLSGLFPWLAACSIGSLTTGIIINQNRLGFDRVVGAYATLVFLICKSIGHLVLHQTPDPSSVILDLMAFSSGMILVL